MDHESIQATYKKQWKPQEDRLWQEKMPKGKETDILEVFKYVHTVTERCMHALLQCL